MTVRLVAFDLDGTILDGGDTVVPDCAEQIRRVHDHGVRCVINSGRSTEFQAELLARLGLLSSFDALVGDERWIELIDTDGQRRPLQPWNTETRHRWQLLEPRAAEIAGRVQDEVRRRGWAGELIDGLDVARRGLWAVRMADPEQALAIFRWVHQGAGDDGIAINCNGGYLHIYDAARDKGSALAAIAEHFGVAPAQVLAFGDNINDLPMLDGRYGFAAATVANAVPEIQRVVRAGGGRLATRASGAGVAELLREAVTPARDSVAE
ncbi:HAD family hydrolase [Microlunatus soli]|uniref:HAD-superfamily hydrolase, subfamily IIB n=1 Tax=Microlunatus soli TaxID=630515 RepID=A0A1H1VKG8_9ACTN|nr:HAD family hydrolase [Microlunatus soli]SDS85387.1 HAD-superfamily hydrolase, subfamily IIB [Microlunatus soli]